MGTLPPSSRGEDDCYLDEEVQRVNCSFFPSASFGNTKQQQINKNKNTGHLEDSITDVVV